MNGILNIYKEAGFTSHDVVARVRGITGQKKTGHTGTLDPGAEGVLPVCLGHATKICGLLSEKEKTYETVMLLGVTTDTQDISGRVLEEKPVRCTKEEIREAVFHFVGEYDQTPPMYSAVRVQGRRLYELAREGRVVERSARRVRILEMDITDISIPEVRFTVTCSSGTYIRTLCHDIGERLGCGACMKYLLRTRVDRFRAKDALRLNEVEALFAAGRLEEVLLPVDRMFDGCPAVYMTPEGDRLAKNGNPFTDAHVASMDGIADMDARVRIYGSDGAFIGLYRAKGGESFRAYRPEKMFVS